MADIDRFMTKVKKQPNGCWEWQASKDADGYGMFWFKHKTQGAHRWSYWYHKGNPNKLQVCHNCDNPSCVNPNHLFLGTTQQNTNDRHIKGRSVRGSKVGTSKLTEKDVYNIKYNLNHLTLKEIADAYNVTITPIYYIRKGKTWKHV